MIAGDELKEVQQMMQQAEQAVQHAYQARQQAQMVSQAVVRMQARAHEHRQLAQQYRTDASQHALARRMSEANALTVLLTWHILQSRRLMPPPGAATSPEPSSRRPVRRAGRPSVTMAIAS